MSQETKHREFWIVGSPTLGEALYGPNENEDAKKTYEEERARNGDKAYIERLVDGVALAEAQSRIKFLEEYLPTTVDQEIHLAKVKELRAEIAEFAQLRGELAEAKAEIERLKSEPALKITATKDLTRIAQLETKLNLKEKLVAELKAEIEGLREDVEMLQSDLKKKSDDIGRSEHRGNTVDYIYDKCATYGKKFDELRAQVAELKGALEKVSKPTNSEILSFEYQRRELVEKQVSQGLNALTREELNELHRLDSLVAPYDIVGILYDELTRLRAENEKLREELAVQNKSIRKQIKVGELHMDNMFKAQAERDALRTQLKEKYSVTFGETKSGVKTCQVNTHDGNWDLYAEMTAYQKYRDETSKLAAQLAKAKECLEDIDNELQRPRFNDGRDNFETSYYELADLGKRARETLKQIRGEG